MAKTRFRFVRSSNAAANVKVSYSPPKPNPTMRSRNLKGQWDVEYSRFFTVPSCQAPVVRSQPLHKSKRSKGTWLPCRTTSSLSIALAPIPGGSIVHVLSLSLGDDLIEEHVLYNLLFSWPQVSCVPECPIRGSRAVFISFKDTSAQIQKFAVRFSNSSVAEEFLKCVKECSKEMLRMPPSKGFIFDPSASKDVPCKFQYMRKRKMASDEMSSEDPEASYRMEEGAPQAVRYNNNTYTNRNEVEDNNRPLEPLMACDNIDSLFSSFPPSFTDLLTNCSSNVTYGEIIPAGESSSAYQNSFRSAPPGCLTGPHNPSPPGTFSTAYHKGPANPCPPVVVPKTEIQETEDESDLIAQISKYMNDDNFQEMLFRIEKLIGGLGGDSAVL